MKNLICKVFGHKKIIRNWYPNDSITTVECLRCGKILNQYDNPAYDPNSQGLQFNDQQDYRNFIMP